MNKKLSICIILLIAVVLTGCTLHTSGLGRLTYNTDTRTYIDAPLSEIEWQAHRPIAISIHANFNVSRILVDIVKVPSDPGYHETLEESVEIIQPGVYQSNTYWTPPDVGRYRLMAYSYTGSRINPWDSWTTHTTYLNIIEEIGGGGEPTPAPMPTAAPVDTAVPPWIDLWADQYTLIFGNCTTLRWDSQRVDQLLLDGAAVAFTGSREVCPSATTTYTLRGTSSAGSVDYPITIHVTLPEAPLEPPIPEPPEPAPLDNTGPTLGSLHPSAVKVFDNAACGADSTTITVNVQDTGGIGRVELHFRARTDSATGTWRIKNMASAGGGNYSATLTNADFAASLATYTPGRIYFLVKAWDSAGNMSESVQMSIETDYCLF